eukprot:7768968-Pyramimonas_sp.AAC.1
MATPGKVGSKGEGPVRPPGGEWGSSCSHGRAAGFLARAAARSVRDLTVTEAGCSHGSEARPQTTG